MKNKNHFGFGRNALSSGQGPSIKLDKLVGQHNLSVEREAAQTAIASFNIEQCSIHENEFLDVTAKQKLTPLNQ